MSKSTITTVLRILIGVTIAALVVSFTHFSKTAPLNRDEAALGYNAYLLSQTGQDEWARAWPLTLESFGDFKLLGYPLTLAALFTVFEPSQTLVRLPAFLGFLLLSIVVYRLAKEFVSSSASILTTLLLLSSPVFIFFGHFGFEAMLALSLFATGIYLLFFTQSNLRWLGVVTLIVSQAFYNTPFLLLPFIGVGYLCWSGPKQLKNWRIPIVLATGWLFFYFQFSTLLSQKSAVTIFSDLNLTLRYNEYRTQFPVFAQPILGNKALFYLPIMLRNFVASFSPQFIVMQKFAHPWHFVPGFSHLNILTWLLGIVGIISTLLQSASLLLQRKAVNKKMVLLLYLLAISLAPSVITIDAPHVTRSLFFLALWLVFAAIGLQALFKTQVVQKHSLANTIFASTTLISVFYALAFLHTLNGAFIARTAQLFQSNLAHSLQNDEILDTQKRIAVVDSGGYQYIHIAWDTLLEPERFHESIIKQDPNWFGFRYGEQLLNVHFINQAIDATQGEHVYEWDKHTNAWVATQ